MSDELQQAPPVGTTWAQPTPEVVDSPQMAVTLSINVPDYAQVRRNALTGQIEIDGITVADLVSLRDSVEDQIVRLEKQQRDGGWEAL